MTLGRRDFCIGAAAGGLVLGAGAARAAEAADYLQLVFNDPYKPEQNTEYERWYSEQHIPDMFNVPGMQTITRTMVLRGATPTSTLAKHLTLYTITTDQIEYALGEPPRRQARGLNPSTPTMDASTTRSIVFRALGPWMKPGPGAAPAKADPKGGPLQTYFMVVLVNPLAPSEAAPDASYDEAHVREVMGAAGMTGARLYTLYRPLTKNYAAPTAMALWRFESGDIDATMADMAARRTAGGVKPLPRWAPDHVQVYYARELYQRDHDHPKG